MASGLRPASCSSHVLLRRPRGNALRFPGAILLVATLALVPCSAAPPELTFAQRVQAQEAIARVHHRHQIGSRRSFAEAVPRQRIEDQVRCYLKQSAALERFWSRPVTAAMLDRELQRMLAGSQLPGRLRELFQALDGDPLVIRECLARPALVERLARGLYAFDPRLHETERRVSVELREALVAGSAVELPLRKMSLERRATAGGREGALPRLLLDDETFESRRRILQAGGGIGPVKQERTAFVVDVLLEPGEDDLRIARYRVEKEPWDDWWRRVEDDLDPLAVATVGTSAPLPAPASRTESAGLECLVDDIWLPIEGGDPALNGSATSVWTGNEMIIWGRSQVPGQRYDPATDTFVPLSAEGAPAPTTDTRVVWTGSEMIAWGGSGSVDIGGRYDPINDTWTSISSVGAPSLRRYHALVWTGERMIVWGGSPSVPGPFDNGGIYDPATDTWEPTPLEGAPDFRRHLMAVWTGTEMIVWGGHDGTPGGLRDDGGRLDPVAGTWSPMSSLGTPDGRSSASAAWTGSEMIIWGGGGGNGKTGGRYNPLTDSWESMSLAQAPSSRIDQAATWTGTELIVWGGLGSGGAGDELADGGRYDPATDDWTALSAVGAPDASRFPTAVWSGTEAIVWGGTSARSGRYDPATDSWTPVSFGVAPAAVDVVWTGNELIVWGGYGTGSRYDPALDVWRLTSREGAHEATGTAVWTGEEMLVWGGRVGSGFEATYPQTGGRYDPLLDTWQPTSVTGQTPVGRSWHTAVWSGSEMIVWGGSDGDSKRGDGGRYDPASDHWQQMATGPEARYRHTAIWTGSEMVIWGGSGELSGILGSGDRYNPVTDQWSPVGDIGAPTGTNLHTAIWTGSEMIVWGGGGSGVVRSAEGGRWDPLSDQWQPTSMDGAPAARDSHTAVWTGERMIVWGGSELYPSGVCCTWSATGGSYDPTSDTWEPTSLVDAPPAMTGHEAVWTGDVMVVWGDRVGGVYSSGPGVTDDDGDMFFCDQDCDDADPDVWELPGEAGPLQLELDAATISWGPATPGGIAVVYDTLRSDLADDLLSAGTFVEFGGSDETSFDATLPPLGGVLHYLARARNACGSGPLYSTSD